MDGRTRDPSLIGQQAESGVADSEPHLYRNGFGLDLCSGVPSNKSRGLTAKPAQLVRAAPSKLLLPSALPKSSPRGKCKAGLRCQTVVGNPSRVRFWLA